MDKIHKPKLIENDQLVLNYERFGTAEISISKLDDRRVIISTISRSGDIGIHVWEPSPKKINSEVWEYQIKTKYECTPIRFGMHVGDVMENADDTLLEKAILDVINHEGPAISPRDVDGFLRLRPAKGARISYTGNWNWRRSTGTRSGHIEITHTDDCQSDTEMYLANIPRDAVQINGFIHLITLLGDRINVSYHNVSHYNNKNGIMLSSGGFAAYDMDYSDITATKSLVAGPTITPMINDMVNALDLDQSILSIIYGHLLGFFHVCTTHQDTKSWHYGVYGAIAAEV